MAKTHNNESSPSVGGWTQTDKRIFLTIALILITNLSMFGPNADSMGRNIGELAMSFVDSRNANLDEFVGTMASSTLELADKASYNNHVYSGQPPGLSFLMAPLYFIVKPAVALISSVANTNTTQVGFIALMLLTSVVIALLVALMATTVGRFSRLLGATVGMANVASVAVVAGSWLLFYGSQVSSKSVATALIFMSFYNLVLGMGVVGQASKKHRMVLLAGLLAGTAVAVDYTPALVAAVLAAYAFWRGGTRTFLLFSAGTVPMGLLTAWYHYAVFGSPFSTAYAHRIAGQYIPMEIGTPNLERLYGLALSPYKGIIFYAPWLTVALAGLVWRRRNSFAPEHLAAAATVVVCFGFNLLWSEWTGGFWGPRYMTVALPFLALMLAFVPGRATPLVWPLVAWGALLNLLPVLHGGMVIGEQLKLTRLCRHLTRLVKYQLEVFDEENTAAIHSRV